MIRFPSCSVIARSMMVLAVIPAIALSAPAVGKVHSALGEVERWKAKQSEWNALRVGANVFQSDRVRTGIESELILRLPDGSSISIAEKADVEISSLLEPNDEGGVETRIDIIKGHLNFAVEKLKNKKSKFIFKTGTATASIRGTEGYIGGEGDFFAGLKTGKLEIVTKSGGDQAVAIGAGETLLDRDTVVVLKLASSGEKGFAKKIAKILADKSKSMKDIVAAVQMADSLYQQELKDSVKKAAAPLQQNDFVVTTNSSVNVCEQGLLVEGAYRTSDETATLVLKVGRGYTSGNLIRSADGVEHSFSERVAINDVNGLWTTDKATLTFVSGGVSSVKTIDLLVNKSCSAVNTKAPKAVITSYDSLRCTANISIGEMKGDAAVVAVKADGSSILEEAVTKNAQKRVKLKKGRHEYVVTVEDQAGNKAEASKTMGCYPMKRFNIDILGQAEEVLRVPPPPKDVKDRVASTLQFSIRIPENDPEYLYKVTVKQNGKVILQESMSQIQNLDYQIPIELNRGAANRLEVLVIHKNGYKATARKVYEVR